MGTGHATRLGIACAALALAPDLDFVPGILVGQPAMFHQGASHSLAFAALAGGSLAFAFRATGLGAGRLFTLGFLAYGSHLAIDLVGTDARPPLGIPVLWPFSDAAYLAPFSLLPGISHAATADVSNAEWIASILRWVNVRAIALEIALVAPLVLVAEWWTRERAMETV